MPHHQSTAAHRSRGRRNLAVMGAGVAACATVGSLLTDASSSWYERLKKPSWQPPSAAFPIVWTSLYAIVAVSAATAVTRLEAQGRDAEASSFRRALAANLVLNAGWSGLFFRAHNLSVATAGAVALAASSAKLARRASSVSSGAALGLGAYTVWCAFATVLSAKLAALNPDE
ncbi:MAG: TspO/MBR family protein [Micropruina sp.]|uniref:TspO/MBR family protein n=1 Tax=Micropruina sp. TaxID=2737536 RepID=UPI0039E46FE4